MALLRLQPLTLLDQLQYLTISEFSHVEDWDQLRLIPSLTQLYLRRNQLPESLNLEHSSALETLGIYQSPEVHHLNLDQCTHLNSLDLIGTNIPVQSIGLPHPYWIRVSENSAYTRSGQGDPEIGLSLRLVLDRNDLYHSAKKELLKFPYNLFDVASVQFLNEPGQDGGGLTRDFITKVSSQMVDPIRGIFKGEKILDESEDSQDMVYYFDKYDASKTEEYTFIGKLLAFAYIRHSPLSIVFRPLFFKLLLNPTLDLTLEDMKEYDVKYYQMITSLLRKEEETEHHHQERLKSFGLTFSDPVDGSPLHSDISADPEVTAENYSQYITLMVNHLAKGKYQDTITAISSAFTEAGITEANADYQSIKNMLTPIFDINVDEWILSLDVQDFEDNFRIKDLFSQMLRQWNQSGDKKKLKELFELATGQNVPSSGFNFITFRLRKEHYLNYPVAHTCSTQVNLKEYQTLEEMIAGFEAAIENFRLSDGLMTIA